ncbi:hypothetical protein FHL15_011068 [Xylaria flabelliformis]|uniref:Major facilitator superfamily (MFS) profile domain-containing protein n=1 Tax=Xylaria flabelliformis TaxID=2512241 RepID=A0A553HJA5_9PEZI|nr:hypothetical protein FHL15_011068 [Xylaria flabelliformis]
MLHYGRYYWDTGVYFRALNRSRVESMGYTSGDAQFQVGSSVYKDKTMNSDIKVLRASDSNPDNNSVQEEPDNIAATPKITWRSYVWDTFDKSPEERRFLFKLDAVVLSLASLGYFIKYLDQVNINSAFVSATQIYVLRFFIGLAESAFYPGMQYVIGSWYRKDELAKRSCIFHSSGAIGSMFSGYLIAAVYRLEGVGGFHGWQWLFIINTVISLPIAIAGFFLFPDVPEITKAWWLSTEDIAMANKRMDLEGRAKRGTYTKAKFQKIFSSWHIYTLVLLYIFFNNGSGYGSQPAFSLWLKSEGYDITAINTYPTIASAVAVLFTYLYAWSSDTIFRGARWPPMVFAGAVNIATNASLAVWDIPRGWKWASYILGSISSGISGLTFAWAHEICGDDNEERAFVTASMNELAYVVQAWLPLIIWQQVDSPRYHKGFITMVFISAALIATAFVIRFLHRRELARKRQLIEW